MTDKLTYKARDRYAVGWTDSRVLLNKETAHIDFGAYRMTELYHTSDELFDIYLFGGERELQTYRARKKEFAACIEAFLQEKKGEHTNGGL